MGKKYNETYKTIRILSKSANLDERYGPWDSIAEANANIPINVRDPGLTVGIYVGSNLIKEYWYNGGILSTNLVPRNIESHSELNLDDGTNPHGTTKTDVGLSNVNNVEQYPNSNPSNFETPSELDTRDTNNRNRNNHTGTQTASTISDFDTEVENNNEVSQNTNHRSLSNNPHQVTKTQVGLGNVDNTSDLNKPISNATQNALNNKENSFNKNTAFNKNFGVLADTVAEGNHTHNLSDLNNDENFISGIDNITEIPNRSYNELQDLPDNANIEFNQTTLELTFTDNEGNSVLIDFKKELGCQLKTTNTISFDWNYIYGSASSPLTGTLSISNTNARIGYIQKIYHDDSTAPSFPASFKVQGTGEYLENASADGLVNTIFVEWSSSTRQAYWITQEEL